MSDYYRNILAKIKKLIKDGQKEAAGRLIREELAMPYLPPGFHERLCELELETNERSAKARLFSSEEISALLNGGADDQLLAVLQLRKLNCRDHYEMLKDYFSGDPDPDCAGLLIGILIEQAVEKMFTITRDKRRITFIPAKLTRPEESSGFRRCLSRLQAILTVKFPREFDLALELLTAGSYRLLPLVIAEEDGEELAEVLIEEVFRRLGCSPKTATAHSSEGDRISERRFQEFVE